MAFQSFVLFVVVANFASSHAQLACGAAGVTCYGLPHGCADVDPSKCDMLAKLSSSPASVHVELTAIPNGPQNLKLTDRYVALGFSEDGMMPKAPVIHCFESKGQAVAKLTWNIDGGNLNVGWAGIDQTPLKVTKTSSNGNGISCIVDLDKKFTISGVPVDLSKSMALIAASGPIIGDTVTVHDAMPDSSAPKMFSF